MPETLYKFAPSAGWITHLWKSVTRQDHAMWRPTLRRLIPPNGVVIDVGAHGGQFTRLLAGLVPRGLVLAVEPSGYARSVLKPAMWARGTRNALVVAMALGDEPGVAMLHTPIKRRGDMGYGLANIAAGASEAASVAEPVAVTTLDLLVAALGLSRVDFVKADIEGHEGALISGARTTLRRYRPALLLELDASHLARAGADINELWAQLVVESYQPHTLADGVLTPLQPDRPQPGDILWLPNP
jgi:FkbM family methyltransferase